MDASFLIDWLQAAVTAHFVFGASLGIMAVFHPDFAERSAHMRIKYKKMAVFIGHTLVGSFVIPYTFHKVMRLRESLRKPIWTIECKDAVTKSGLTWKEAQEYIDVLVQVKRLGGEEFDRVEVDVENHILRLISKEDD